SFSFLQTIYQFTDVIQGYFLRTSVSKPCPPDCITHLDLLPFKLDVGTIISIFIGVIVTGDHSNLANVLLYLWLNIMAYSTFGNISILLMLRKIILWLIIITSPILAFLTVFKTTRSISRGV